MTDLLNPGDDDVILEIGTGSGYQTAVLSCLVKKVYSMEYIKELSESATARLQHMVTTTSKPVLGTAIAVGPKKPPMTGSLLLLPQLTYQRHW